ncbi:hypothetical protein DL96DRAFT_1461291 [Flagelloscypha sp. PMI_526]|nr:hypothetical protein DL96DRAFT_1461291 [Flagelloscypha sp. PMI_526]
MTALGPEPRTQLTIEETLAEWDSIPLFMKSLPTEDVDDSKLAALQSLVFDGTPDEVASNFKDQGNDYFKGKRYREAVGFYTQGIDANPTDASIMEALLNNRAACNLELKNYGSVLRDCSRSLGINQKSSKAFYRSALALHALERFEEGIDCCHRCLVFDPDNIAVRQLEARLISSKEAKEKREREKAERKRKEMEMKEKFDVAFKQRNILTIPTPDSTSSNPYSPHFDPEDPTSTTLIIPTFFLYPQHATSDVIPEFVETTPFTAHLEAMFPPAAPPPQWDKAQEYRKDTLNVYAITKRKRLLKVGKKMTMFDVCMASKAKEGEPKDGMELKEGCLSFIVVPKGAQEEKWIKEFKAQRGF